MAARSSTSRALPRWAVAGLLVLILAITAGLRLYRIGEVPPGPHFDEASIAFDALDVLAGRHTVFSERPYGREMFFVYVAAPLVKLLGPTTLAVRLPTAIVGILTVLATYFLARELLAGEEKRKGQVAALLAAAFLALSFWHLAINRLGFRANYLPLTETLCFLFFWRAVRTDRLRDYVLSGLFLGLGLNTYISARFVPVVLVATLAVLTLTGEGRALILQRWRRWALLAAVALLVFAPLLVYFVQHPDSFIERARGISIFSPWLQQGNFWGLVVRSVLGNAGTFGFQGDQSWTYNIPGRPGWPPVQAVLFWAGLVLCLVRWRKPRYLFLPVWWFVILLPSILAPDPIPHHLRAIGTLPVAAILSALTVAELVSFISSRPARLRAVLLPLLLVPLLLYLAWTGYDTWRSYFHDWQQRDEVYYAYHGHIADLAQTMNQDSDPEAVYLFPLNYDLLDAGYEEFPLELQHPAGAPVHYLVVDDATVAADLAGVASDGRHVRLIVWTHGWHVDADPRQVLPFYLEKYGEKTAEETARGYRIDSYELTSVPADLLQPLDFVEVPAGFGDDLRLQAVARAPAAPSGEPVWVALHWQAGPAPDRDLKASLRLYDDQEHLAGQSDALLLSSDHRATSRWQPGEAVTSYHLVASAPGTMPGRYQLGVTVYDAGTQQPLPAAGEGQVLHGNLVTLGEVEIERPLRQSQLQPEEAVGPLPLAPGLDLIGYALDRTALSPGETLNLGLYWRAPADTEPDHGLSVRLAGEDGRKVARWTEAFAYPTSQWRAGDQWRQWLALRIPPEAGAGDYQLGVGLTGGDAVDLARVSIQGRPRTFEVPPIQHPLPAQLGEGIQFLGYDLGDEVLSPGEPLGLTLYWQALGQPGTSYTVFTHLLDGSGQLWGQQDGIPGRGSLPTSGWLPGEVIADPYEIAPEGAAPAGEYTIKIGMYRADTGERLPLFDAGGRQLGDHLVLDTPVRVER